MLRPPLPCLPRPKNHPRTAGGPAMQAPTSKRQDYRKNSTALSKFHRRSEHCSPAKALRYHKAPRVEQSPTPTITRKKMRLNFIALSKFHRRGEHCSPAFAAPAALKKSPPHRYGPAMQAPTSKRQGLCKNSTALSKFHRRGGAWLRPPWPQLQPKKYSPAPLAGLQCRPLQAKGKAYAKILSLFQNFIVGARLGSARPCRTRRPKKITPAPRGKALPPRPQNAHFAPKMKIP